MMVRGLQGLSEGLDDRLGDMEMSLFKGGPVVRHGAKGGVGLAAEGGGIDWGEPDREGSGSDGNSSDSSSDNSDSEDDDSGSEDDEDGIDSGSDSEGEESEEGDELTDR